MTDATTELATEAPTHETPAPAAERIYGGDDASIREVSAKLVGAAAHYCDRCGARKARTMEPHGLSYAFVCSECPLPDTWIPLGDAVCLAGGQARGGGE